MFDEVISENMPTPCIKYDDEYVNVSALFDYEEPVEIPEWFSVINRDKDIGKYKSEYSFDCHPVVPGDTYFQGVSSLFTKSDSMHYSSVEESYQFDPGIFMHADPSFHNKQYVNDVPSLHYESQDSYFVLPTEIIQISYVSGETDRKVVSSLPQSSKSQNQVYDRGRELWKVSMARGHFVQ